MIAHRIALLLPLAFAACTPPPAAIPLVVVPVAPAAPAASPVDQAFAAAAGQSGLFAVLLAQLATQKVARPAVRDFAQGVLDSQAQANARLNGLAQARGIVLPSGPTAAQDRVLASMAQQPDGIRFRRTFFAELIKSHVAAIRGMDGYVATGTDPALRAYAVDQAQVLRAQVATARRLPRDRSR